MVEEWHMDLDPPTRMPPESPPATFKDLKRVFLAISRHVGKVFKPLFEDGLTPAFKRLTRSTPAQMPYKHDPPTNKIYPTSQDSWCNEFNQPLRSSQVYRTRRPYRR